MRRKLTATLYSFQYLEPTQVADPYRVSRSWFIEWQYIDVIENMNRWFDAVLSKTIWPEEAPYLMDFHESFIMAIEAGYLMNNLYNDDRPSVFKDIKTDVEIFNNPQWFCEADVLHHPFTYFPRSLTIQEFCNPYLVFKEFFKRHDLAAWKRLLHLLVDMSLTSEQSLYDLEDFNLLTCRQMLDKFVDAMHLINVREYPKKLIPT